MATDLEADVLREKKIRHEPRFTVRDLQSTVVTFAVSRDAAQPSDSMTFEGFASDVSPSGLRLALNGTPPIGEEATIHFRIPEIDVDLMLDGITRWVQPKDADSVWVGCELFTPISDETLQAMAIHGIVDRRQDERYPANCRAKAKWELSRQVSDVTVVNYSLGGCSIKTDRVVELPSDRLMLVFEDGKGQETSIPVRVIWTRAGTRFGCEFLSNQCFLKMRRFVESLDQAEQRLVRQDRRRGRHSHNATAWRWIAIAAFVLLALQSLAAFDHVGRWADQFQKGWRSLVGGRVEQDRPEPLSQEVNVVAGDDRPDS